MLAVLVLAACHGMSVAIIHLSQAELPAWVRLRGMDLGRIEAEVVEYAPLKQVGYCDLLVDLPSLAPGRDARWPLARFPPDLVAGP